MARRAVSRSTVRPSTVAAQAGPWGFAPPSTPPTRSAPPGDCAAAMSAACGVTVDGRTVEADVVVLAMGPWTGRVGGLELPAVRGLKGYSVTLAAADVPAHALFVDYRTAEGRQLEPEIIPRPDGEVYVCGMADPAPLPDSPDEVEVREAACAVLARAA